MKLVNLRELKIIGVKKKKKKMLPKIASVFSSLVLSSRDPAQLMKSSRDASRTALVEGSPRMMDALHRHAVQTGN